MYEGSHHPITLLDLRYPAQGLCKDQIPTYTLDKGKRIFLFDFSDNIKTRLVLYFQDDHAYVAHKIMNAQSKVQVCLKLKNNNNNNEKYQHLSVPQFYSEVHFGNRSYTKACATPPPPPTTTKAGYPHVHEPCTSTLIARCVSVN